jgi:hypothetical protein
MKTAIIRAEIIMPPFNPNLGEALVWGTGAEVEEATMGLVEDPEGVGPPGTTMDLEPEAEDSSVSTVVEAEDSTGLVE